jgi:hypothetical protein
VVLLEGMAQPNLALRSPHLSSAELPADGSAADVAAPDAPDPTSEAAWNDVLRLLRKAAKLAATHGGDTDPFMQAAWAACLDARPGLREEIEDKELRSQLKKLRKRGLVGAA